MIGEGLQYFFMNLENQFGKICAPSQNWANSDSNLNGRLRGFKANGPFVISNLAQGQDKTCNNLYRSINIIWIKSIAELFILQLNVASPDVHLSSRKLILNLMYFVSILNFQV